MTWNDDSFNLCKGRIIHLSLYCFYYIHFTKKQIKTTLALYRAVLRLYKDSPRSVMERGLDLSILIRIFVILHLLYFYTEYIFDNG